MVRFAANIVKNFALELEALKKAASELQGKDNDRYNRLLEAIQARIKTVILRLDDCLKTASQLDRQRELKSLEELNGQVLKEIYEIAKGLERMAPDAHEALTTAFRKGKAAGEDLERLEKVA